MTKLLYVFLAMFPMAVAIGIIAMVEALSKIAKSRKKIDKKALS